MYHVILTVIFLLSLHDYDAKLYKFTFYGQCEHKITFLFVQLSYRSLEFTPRKIRQHFGQIERDRITTKKFETAPMLFLSDVFAVVAVVVA